MSSNNQPPFKVICIDPIDKLIEGREYIVTEASKAIQDIHEEPIWYVFDLGQYYFKRRFSPINPYQSDVTKELAEKALSVGDSVDQPVKKLVNN